MHSAQTIEQNRQRSAAMIRALTARRPARRVSVQPEPIKLIISFADFVEAVRLIRLDDWQRDLCRRLENALLNRHDSGIMALIHGFPQSGKSSIIAQTYPAWIFGHDPTHRFKLATYNISKSKDHGNVVKRVMQSQEFAEIFPDKACHLPRVSKEEKWSTFARTELNDGQDSFACMGLQSGFVGSGADTLLMDDPYASPEDAYSETIRNKTGRFFTDTAKPRMTEFSNVFAMFHRYHEDDLGGRLLKTGKFDYWRYAAEADGDYVEDQTAQTFPDPINRRPGELISSRWTRKFFDEQKQNAFVWNSQFQGRASGEGGNFFDVKMLKPVASIEQFETRHGKIIVWVRAWDNAATETESSAFTVGALLGMTASGKCLIADVVRERLNTARRYAKQLETAEADGYNVNIHLPNDPGSAGTDTAFETLQMLSAYQAEATSVTGSKVVRALSYSKAVNSGDVSYLIADWNREYLNELDKFPLSTYKDQTDASSDAYRVAYAKRTRGRVLHTYDEPRNLITATAFQGKFGRLLPNNWNLYAAVKLAADASQPNAACVLAHAPEAANVNDAVFLLGEYKRQTPVYADVFDWIARTIEATCEPAFDPMHAVQFPGKKQPRTNLSVIVSDNGKEDAVNVLNRKLEVDAVIASGLATSGVAEINWYAEQTARHIVKPESPGARLYFVVDPNQYNAAADEAGLKNARQEAATWSYNTKGEPNPTAILDCVRMILSGFATFSSPMTKHERLQQHLRETIGDTAISDAYGSDAFPEMVAARTNEEKRFERREQLEQKNLDDLFSQVLGGNLKPLGGRRRK